MNLSNANYIKENVLLIHAAFYTSDMDQPIAWFDMYQMKCVFDLESIRPAKELPKYLSNFERSEYLEWEIVLAYFIQYITVVLNANVDPGTFSNL
jgi:hypothetical protein